MPKDYELRQSMVNRSSDAIAWQQIQSFSNCRAITSR